MVNTFPEPTFQEKRDILSQIRSVLIRMKRAYKIHFYYINFNIREGFNFPPIQLEHGDIAYDDNLYAFYAHVRVFNNIFTNCEKYRWQEVQARDFVSWVSIEKETYYKKEIKSSIGQINSYLSHLDYNVVRSSGYDLHNQIIINKIYKYFINVLTKFVDKLDNINYKKEKEEIKEVLNTP
jgi:hypothetical protein